MTEERRKQLAAGIEGTEELCNYCPLPAEAKSVHFHGGEPIMCVGMNCDRAFDAYLDKREEKEKYVAESIAEIQDIEITEALKAEIAKLSDAELDEEVDWAYYLEGK